VIADRIRPTLGASVVAAMMLFAACGGTGEGRSETRSRQLGGTSESPASPRAPGVLTLAHCDGAFIPEREFARRWRRHTRVGAIMLPDIRGLAEPGLASQRDRRVLKLPVLIRPARVLELEIAPRARSGVGFVKVGMQSWRDASDLHSTLRVTNCPPIPPEAGELPAGPYYALPLFLGVRRDACVPLAVTRNRGRMHRYVISFGRGRCTG
jgi:hypothetical protein